MTLLLDEPTVADQELDFLLSEDYTHKQLPELSDIQEELAVRRLESFIKIMWPYVDNHDFLGGWHIGYQ